MVPFTTKQPAVICFGDSLTAGFQSPTQEHPAGQETPYGLFLQERLGPSVEVRVSGPGSGRESAIRALAASGILLMLMSSIQYRRRSRELKEMRGVQIKWHDAAMFSSMTTLALGTIVFVALWLTE